MAFDKIEDAIMDIREGRMIIIVDDEDRENEGDFMIAAEHVTPDAINFMATHGRGLICLAMTSTRLEELQIPMMVNNNTSAFETAFTISIDSKDNISTGISAKDRAVTILKAIDPSAARDDFVYPGHIFPLRAKDGGVLVRTGQTEGAVDVSRLAGLYPAGVICEIMNEDGSMARVPQLLEIKKKFNLKMITIKDLIEYRIKKESLIKRAVSTTMPTDFGLFEVIAYESRVDSQVHVAFIKGKINPEKDTLVRVHSQCLTGDVFHSNRCDCGEQLHTSLNMIAKEGNGVLLYLYQEGRGIGLVNKLRSYSLQDKGKDTVQANKDLGFEPDLRDYGIGAQVLADLNITSIRLITNNPRKIIGLEGYGLKIKERVPLLVLPTKHNINYLKTKQSKLGHFLDLI